jgi:hypothetical protein
MNSPFYKHDSYYGVCIISSYITATIIRHCDDILFVHKNAPGFLLFCGPGESCKTKTNKNIKKPSYPKQI